jgi:DNA repair exonuclease SbcCD ATPase subunit
MNGASPPAPIETDRDREARVRDRQRLEEIRERNEREERKWREKGGSLFDSYNGPPKDPEIMRKRQEEEHRAQRLAELPNEIEVLEGKLERARRELEELQREPE